MKLPVPEAEIVTWLLLQAVPSDSSATTPGARGLVAPIVTWLPPETTSGVHPTGSSSQTAAKACLVRTVADFVVVMLLIPKMFPSKVFSGVVMMTRIRLHGVESKTPEP